MTEAIHNLSLPPTRKLYIMRNEITGKLVFNPKILENVTFLVLKQPDGSEIDCMVFPNQGDLYHSVGNLSQGQSVQLDGHFKDNGKFSITSMESDVTAASNPLVPGKTFQSSEAVSSPQPPTTESEQSSTWSYDTDSDDIFTLSKADMELPCVVRLSSDGPDKDTQSYVDLTAVWNGLDVHLRVFKSDPAYKFFRKSQEGDSVEIHGRHDRGKIIVNRADFSPAMDWGDQLITITLDGYACAECGEEMKLGHRVLYVPVFDRGNFDRYVCCHNVSKLIQRGRYKNEQELGDAIREKYGREKGLTRR